MMKFVSESAVRVLVKIMLKQGEFELILQPPSFEDRMLDDGLGWEIITSNGGQRAAAHAHRFMCRMNRVVGWNGVVNAKGEPIEFSLETLKQLVNRHPAAIDQLSAEFLKLYSTDEAELGESEGPSAEPPQEAEAQQTKTSANSSSLSE